MQMLYQKILMAFFRCDVVVLVSQVSLKDLEECLSQKGKFLRLEHCNIGIKTEAYLHELVEGEANEEERKCIWERNPMSW